MGYNSLKMNTGIRFLLAFVFFLSAHSYSRVSESQHPHLNVKIISDVEYLAPGTNANIAVHFEIEKGWHLYWKNPGDTGLAPQTKWTHPQNTQLTLGEWAFPESIPVSHLTNYGYKDELLLVNKLTVGKEFNDSHVDLNADISWLVCKESCIPGKTQLSKRIKMHSEPKIKEANLSIFKRWQTALPENLKIMDANAHIQGEYLEVNIYSQHAIFTEAKHVDVFIANFDLVEYGDPVAVHWKNNLLRWKQKLSEYFEAKPSSVDLVIVVDNKASYKLNLKII